jgi:hypothetical protein
LRYHSFGKQPPDAVAPGVFDATTLFDS